MIEAPDRYLEDFVKAGADSLTVHVEAAQDLSGTLGAIRSLGVRTGVSISPGTAADEAADAIENLDLFLVMTVRPGFSGQSFMPGPLEEVRRVRKWKAEGKTQALIQVDGGIDAETAPLAAQAGAEVFVAASAVFRHEEGIAAGINAINDALEAGSSALESSV